MKKKTGNEVIGRTVMVHPFLTTDPIQRQGDIGKVTEVSKENSEVLIVEFSDGKKGAYFSYGLLTLQPPQVILQGLTSNQKMLAAQDQSRILKIYQLTVDNKHIEALRLARINETTRFFCTTSCDKWVDMKNEQKLNRSKGRKL